MISLLWLLTGCIREGLISCDPKGLVNMEKFDWSLTDTPDADTQVKITITDEDGNAQDIIAGSDGTLIELEDGTYAAVAVQEVSNVTHQGTEVKVDLSTSGVIPQIPSFDAGESKIIIKNGSITEGETIYMIRQTRELIVIVHILSVHGLFANIPSLNGLLEGVITSRDILMGFPPRPATEREMVKPVWAPLNMTLAKTTEASTDDDKPLTYTFRQRLLGIETEIEKNFTISAVNFNGHEEETTVASFDVKEMLAGFHTVEPEEPYVLILEMEEDPSSGTIKIKDWSIGDESDLIAEEQ